jgi:hypothetical protein
MSSGSPAGGDVEVDSPMLRSPALIDLGPDGPGGHIPAHELGGLALLDGFLFLPLDHDFLGTSRWPRSSVSAYFPWYFGRDVLEHEPLALVVFQHPPLAPYALGDEESPDGGGPDHARRVELHDIPCRPARLPPDRPGRSRLPCIPRSWS